MESATAAEAAHAPRLFLDQGENGTKIKKARSIGLFLLGIRLMERIG